MATIKDVAKLANVSVTTVSIIINGKSEERKISAITQERVQNAMRELGYQPNLSARRLRSQDSKKPVIAFFWPLDYRTAILASFLNSLQLEIQRINFDCELVIQTYENDKLDQYDASILKHGYSGIIIGACSRADLEYLEKLSPQMPLVLINRYSEHFSTICTDNQEIGMMAARQIQKSGYTEAAVITAQHSYVATGLRTQAFLYACAELGINIQAEHIFKTPSTISGGYHAAQELCRTENPPKMIFCDSDIMAIGALSAFHQNHVRIPEDMELLSIAMLDPEYGQHTIPPLSVIEMPNQEIGKQLINLLKEKITANSLEPTHINLDASLILRESFRGADSL